jgi:hypothetical protein
MNLHTLDKKRKTLIKKAVKKAVKDYKEVYLKLGKK